MQSFVFLDGFDRPRSEPVVHERHTPLMLRLSRCRARRVAYERAGRVANAFTVLVDRHAQVADLLEDEPLRGTRQLVGDQDLDALEF